MSILLWVLLGLSLGSFVNVCLHRLPEGRSLLRPGSHCPRCQAPIQWRDNVPLLSHLWLRGRCRSCGRPISLLYPAVELLAAALLLALYWRHGARPFFLWAGAPLTTLLLAVSLIDAKHQIIPDVLSLGLLGAGLLLSPWNPLLGTAPLPRLLWAGAGVLAGFGLMLAVAFLGRALWKKDALGGGDVKLMAALGAFLGWGGVLATLALGSFLGTLWAAALFSLKKLRRGSYLPFGPFLALAAWILWLRAPNVTLDLRQLWGF